MRLRARFATVALSVALGGGLAGLTGDASAATNIDSRALNGQATQYGQSLLSRALAYDTDGAMLSEGENVQLVQRRGRSYRRGPRARDRRSYRDRRRSRGRDVGIGIGAVIVGGIIASQAARADRQAMLQCDARFRSFDWDTGTYVTYGGDVRVCPYLR